MNGVDRLFAFLEAGLRAPLHDPIFSAGPPVHHDGCLRCTAEVVPGSEFCEACRAYLLGHSAHDPCRGREGRTSPEVGEHLAGAFADRVQLLDPLDAHQMLIGGADAGPL